MHNPLDHELLLAVSLHQVEKVKSLLDRGANPNYTVHTDEEEPDGILQPTTPLRMVIFRISDAMLHDGDLVEFAAIARMLLRAGANPFPAMQLAEFRYGKYDPYAPASPFMNVWHIVASAAVS